VILVVVFSDGCGGYSDGGDGCGVNYFCSHRNVCTLQ